MGDISKNLSRGEMACNCGCGFDAVDAELLSVFQDCCDHFAEKLGVAKVVAGINSGCRCESHNAKEGGAPGSQHVRGKAMDFWIKDVHADEVADYLESKYPDKYGIGRYVGRTHVDVRSDKAYRWDYR